MAENTSTGGATTTAALLRSVVVADGETEEKNIIWKERPKEPWKGEYVRSIVYAGLDAIITSFSLISSISAGRLSSGTFNFLTNFYFV